MQQTSDELNNRLSKYKNECGCALGAKFMLFAFLAYLLINISHYGIISIGFLIHLPLTILISVLAAGIGKTIGILYARYKYKQLSKQLSSNPSI